MKVRPLHDRLLVRRLEEKEASSGGIIIPDTAKEKPQQGEVLAVGNGRILENGTKVALDVKVGDKVLFGKYNGSDVTIEGEDVLVLREEEVLAVLAYPFRRKEGIPCRSRSRTATSPGRPSCAASAAWRTRSR